MGKKDKLLQEKALIGKVLAGIIALLVALGIFPSEFKELLGQGIIESIATAVAIIIGVFIGKDIELKDISKQLGMDQKAVKKYVRSKTFKDIIAKLGVMVFSITTITIL